MNNDQLWESVLGEIEITLSKANFTTWFKDTFISTFEDEQIIICVPNMFTKTWLENKYNKQIKQAIENISHKKIKKIFYKIEIKKNNSVDGLLRKIKLKKNNENNSIISINRFGLNTRYFFDSFIVGKGNELAHAASQAVAANPGKAYNPLFIYGDVGLGKTHLLQAIGHEILKKTDKILYITSEKFTNDYIQAVKVGNAKEFKEKYRGVDLLLVDDIQFMGGKDGTQQEFFHTFNELHQGDKQIVISSDRPPKAIPAMEKRLLSRFEWGMIADVGQLDIETRMAILKAKCSEKKYHLEDKILYYLSENIQNNIRELEGALNRLIAYHEFNNTKPTINSTKEILNNLIINIKTKSTTIKSVINTVSNFFDVEIKDILGKSRKKELVYPRQISMFLIREEIGSSFPTIGNELGGRDHTTAMHAHNKIKKEHKENGKIKQDIESIKQLLYRES